MSRKNIWAIVGLVGLYVVCQAIADVGATKMVEVAGMVVPSGSIIFAVTFTVRDMLHKRLGKEWARAAIILAGAFNVLQAVYLAAMARMPWPVWFELGEAWSAVFSLVPAITAGSITAEVVSELVDTEVYHWTMRRRFPQWARVVLSNAVSLPLDSFIFGSLAFFVLPPLFGAQGMTFSLAMAAVAGQIVWKAGVTLVSIPGIYMVRERPLLGTELGDA